MTPHQRFAAILERRPPDRLPFYFPTIACSVASVLLGREVDSGADSLHFKEERSWLDGEDAHAEFVARYHENALALNRLLRADVVRETWRCSARPTRQLDEHTLLFGDETGPTSSSGSSPTSSRMASSRTRSARATRKNWSRPCGRR